MFVRIAVFVFLVAIVMAVTGCGEDKASSPFTGTWHGSWADSAQNGTLNLTVLDNGVVSGSVVNATQQSATGTVSGTLDTTGRALLTYTYPGNTIFQASGIVTLGANGHVTGGLVEDYNGQQIGTAQVDLQRFL